MSIGTVELLVVSCSSIGRAGAFRKRRITGRAWGEERETKKADRGKD